MKSKDFKVLIPGIALVFSACFGGTVTLPGATLSLCCGPSPTNPGTWVMTNQTYNPNCNADTNTSSPTPSANDCTWEKIDGFPSGTTVTICAAQTVSPPWHLGTCSSDATVCGGQFVTPAGNNVCQISN